MLIVFKSFFWKLYVIGISVAIFQFKEKLEHGWRPLMHLKLQGTPTPNRHQPVHLRVLACVHTIVHVSWTVPCIYLQRISAQYSPNDPWLIIHHCPTVTLIYFSFALPYLTIQSLCQITRVAEFLKGHEVLFDCSRAYESIEYADTSGLVVGTACPRPTKWLLTNYGTCGFLVVINISSCVA